jgi:hypothetical protein
MKTNMEKQALSASNIRNEVRALFAEHEGQHTDLSDVRPIKRGKDPSISFSSDLAYLTDALQPASVMRFSTY